MNDLLALIVRAREALEDGRLYELAAILDRLEELCLVGDVYGRTRADRG